MEESWLSLPKKLSVVSIDAIQTINNDTTEEEELLIETGNFIYAVQFLVQIAISDIIQVEIHDHKTTAVFYSYICEIERKKEHDDRRSSSNQPSFGRGKKSGSTIIIIFVVFTGGFKKRLEVLNNKLE